MSDQDRPGELAFTVTPTDHPTSAEDRAALLVNPGFGKVFTDHMALATWCDWQESNLRRGLRRAA